MRHAPIGAAMLLSLGGCSWSTTTHDDAIPCDAPVQVTVVPGSPQRISWAPACGFKDLTIVDAAPSPSTPPAQWQISANSRLIVPGIEYGVVPRGVTGVYPPAPLASGRTYQLELTPIRAGAPPTRVTWTP
ncbi:hypothetical protein J421_1349 [Gemmatirosa kalamazoonensis]|uniref:Lipoprotein n=2 Tax=Gemmatirosa kalamazoonensis TaxID=861299 RepID=W0RDL3_9BACT|nr:hypothetical protein J421_1349 [Gemmatirosa kalamazoonensis]